jgi:hypothetical protein
MQTNKEDLHYTSCGLNNVFLKNIDVSYCLQCKDTWVRIPCIEDLYNCIAHRINMKEGLTDNEIIFLEKYSSSESNSWPDGRKWVISSVVDNHGKEIFYCEYNIGE